MYDIGTTPVLCYYIIISTYYLLLVLLSIVSSTRCVVKNSSLRSYYAAGPGVRPEAGGRKIAQPCSWLRAGEQNTNKTFFLVFSRS